MSVSRSDDGDWTVLTALSAAYDAFRDNYIPLVATTMVWLLPAIVLDFVGASRTVVVAGHVPLVISNIDSLMGQVNGGKLKAVASTGAKRSATTPDTPTFAEAGFPDLVVTSWSIWAVPAGTPARIKAKLEDATERALAAPDVIESMRQGGFEPGAMALPEVKAFIKTEHKRWGEVIRAAGIKPQ